MPDRDRGDAGLVHWRATIPPGDAERVRSLPDGVKRVEGVARAPDGGLSDRQPCHRIRCRRTAGSVDLPQLPRLRPPRLRRWPGPAPASTAVQASWHGTCGNELRRAFSPPVAGPLAPGSAAARVDTAARGR